MPIQWEFGMPEEEAVNYIGNDTHIFSNYQASPHSKTTWKRSKIVPACKYKIAYMIQWLHEATSSYKEYKSNERRLWTISGKWNPFFLNLSLLQIISMRAGSVENHGSHTKIQELQQLTLERFTSILRNSLLSLMEWWSNHQYY